MVKAFLGNSATWIVTLAIAALSFFWTQSGRISALEANSSNYRDQLNRIEQKVDWLIENRGK